MAVPADIHQIPPSTVPYLTLTVAPPEPQTSAVAGKLTETVSYVQSPMVALLVPETQTSARETVISPAPVTPSQIPSGKPVTKKGLATTPATTTVPSPAKTSR
jgi:hypothetical protein